MKKMKPLIIVILISVLLIGISAGVWYYKTKFYIPDKDGMVRDLSDTVTKCTYSSGGGMEGSYESLEISVRENGEVWLEYSSLPYIGAEEETVSHTVPAEAIEEIRSLCRKTGVLNWGELSDSDELLLDAPTTSISFTYGDGEYYSVSSNDKLPKKGTGFFSEVYNILFKYK